MVRYLLDLAVEKPGMMGKGSDKETGQGDEVLQFCGLALQTKSAHVLALATDR